MDDAERSERWVTNQLDRLEETYGSAPVHQLGWTVPAARYERAADAEDTERAAAGVRVTNGDEETLLVRDHLDEWVCPRGPVETGESLEAGARRNVREATGVSCAIESVERVTIVSIGDETDRERPRIYCLVVRFVGSCGPDERVECADSPVRWRSSRPTDRLDAGVLAI
jgi:8-oxo-dGTP diphosphatase